MSRQVEFERSMQDAGRAKFFASIKRAKTSQFDGESTTAYGVSMMRMYVDALACHIRLSVKKYKGKPGVTPVAWEYLDGQDYRLVAYIAAQTIINSISGTSPLTRTAIRIANKVEDNLRIEMLRKHDRKYLQSTKRFIKANKLDSKRSSAKNVILSSFDKSEKTPEWTPWKEKHKLHIGIALIQAFIHVTSDHDEENRAIPGTGLVEKVSIWRNQSESQYHLCGTNKAADWIRTSVDISKDMHPDFWPCIEPPISWTSPTDGGYHTEEVRRTKPLVKPQRRPYLKDLHGRENEMPQFYDTVNILQSVPWEINTVVYNVMQQEFKRRDGIGMPSLEPIEIPRNPLPAIDTKGMSREQARKAKVRARRYLTQDQKREYAEWHQTYLRLAAEERSRVSQCLQISSTLSMARSVLEEDSVYFVWSADFRGRLYQACTTLSQQGTEKSKALLKFRRGVPLGKGGFRHLALYAASLYGKDKLSQADRLAWVEENKEAIIATADDPEETREFWGRADDPYLFLSVCLELGDVYNLSTQERQEYVSYLPVPKDGKCNGIQHFSAMLCDPVSAEAVCLSDSEVPNDIYIEVADRVMQDLQKTIDDSRGGMGFKRAHEGWEPCGKFDLDMAKAWLEFGVDRKCTKKPTMVLPYGGTKIACRDQMQDYINEKIQANIMENPDYISPFSTLEVPDSEGKSSDPEKYASAFITHYVWAALDHVVVASRKAMKFLQEMAAAINKDNPGCISWRTPTGFKVCMDVRDTRASTVETFLDGKLRLKFREELDTFNKYKMKSSLAPNFVHSMDSSHLQMAITAGHAAGIKDFACVHDSFSVHAGNCDLFDRIIRSTFRELHRDNLLVEFWRQQVKQRPHLKDEFPNPKDVARGDFDLDEVLTSRHFFG
jgi:DNA-directed RNA polymerase, mitochondrial